MPRISLRSKWLVLANVLFTAFMGVLDGNIVNVALPTMADELGVTVGQATFIVLCYMFAATSFLLVFGRLGDIFGKVRIFRGGILVFTIGSLLCGLCTNLPALIASRIVQALGASAMLGTNMGIVTETFPPNQRGIAFGVVGSVVAIGGMLGPILGGFIVSYFAWEYLFLINVPIGLIAFAFSFASLRSKRPESEQRVDLPGAVLLVGGMLCLSVALAIGQETGFGNAPALGALAAVAVLVAAFVLVERRQRHPLIAGSLFSNQMCTISLVCSLLGFLCNSTVFILMPLYLEAGLGLEASAAGALLSISPLIIMVLAPVSGRLADRFGAAPLTVFGLVICSIGLLLLSLLREGTPIPAVVGSLCVMSFGWALYQTPNNALIMSFAPREHLGIMGGFTAFMRNLGMSLGLSVSTATLFALMSLHIGRPVHEVSAQTLPAFFPAFSTVLLIMCGVCLVGAGLTVWRLVIERRRLGA